LLIGAEGLHSQVRALTVGEVARRFTGTTCWRLVTQNPGVTSALEAWGGPARVGLVPLRGERVYAYLVLEAPARAGAPGFPQAFKARFGHFGGVVGRFIEALQEAPPLHHDLEELDAPAWGAGRVLLLGDAAHAMTPNQGQGAGMAIEDAVALAQALRPGADGALERYVALRHARVRRMQLDSRRIGRVAHWSNPAGTFVRDALLQLTPARTATAQYRRGVLPGLRLLER
jgi:2-polyprenyl-6-methoxyphenol hydroxylase-like FAD-dependent oxidoreductase